MLKTNRDKAVKSVEVQQYTVESDLTLLVKRVAQAFPKTVKLTCRYSGLARFSGCSGLAKFSDKINCSAFDTVTNVSYLTGCGTQQKFTSY